MCSHKKIKIRKKKNKGKMQATQPSQIPNDLSAIVAVECAGLRESK